MRKICFVSGVIARSGGTERVGSIIANSLSKAGYDVFLLSFWNQGKPYFHLEDEVHVHYLLNHKIEGKFYRTGIYPIIKLHRFIQNNDIDIIVDIDTVLSRHSAYAIRGTKCKLISWEHFNYWTMLRLKEARRFRAKQLIKKYATELVVLTEQDREAHIKHLGFDENLITAIPNPCMEVQDSVYDFDKKIFLSIGRLTPPKGYDWLLEAWSRIENYIPDWKLRIVGSGEDEIKLKKQKDDLRLQNVEFIPHTTDVGKYYSTASAYVLSSRYEGFPMVLLEAEVYGLPIIAFDCKTGPHDLVCNGENGYLVDEANIQKLANSMLDFTKDKERADRMSQKSRSFVKRFNLNSVTLQWVGLIEAILNN